MKVTNPVGSAHYRKWSDFLPGTILRFKDTDCYYLRVIDGLVCFVTHTVTPLSSADRQLSYLAVESLTLTSEFAQS